MGVATPPPLRAPPPARSRGGLQPLYLLLQEEKYEYEGPGRDKGEDGLI